MKIILQSNDKEQLEVDRNMIRLSATLNTMCQEFGIDGPKAGVSLNDPVLLVNVNAAILRKLLQWCQYHKDDPSTADDTVKNKRRLEDICSWDIEFIKENQSTMFKMIAAANYLQLKSFIEIACTVGQSEYRISTSEERKQKELEDQKYQKKDPPTANDSDNKERRTDDISQWEAEFFDVDPITLGQLLDAAYLLRIDSLHKAITARGLYIKPEPTPEERKQKEEVEKKMRSRRIAYFIVKRVGIASITGGLICLAFDGIMGVTYFFKNMMQVSTELDAAEVVEVFGALNLDVQD